VYPHMRDFIDFIDFPAYHPFFMNTSLPEIVDVWRMVAGRRIFQGKLPQSSLQRLTGSLADAEAFIVYYLEFGKDDFGVAYLNIQAETPLTLICQRSLESFVLPVRVETRLGLITHEQEETALPKGYEPLIIENGQLHLTDVIEDELILALPIVPIDPESEVIDSAWNSATSSHHPTQNPNPFAALVQLKKDR